MMMMVLAIIMMIVAMIAKWQLSLPPNGSGNPSVTAAILRCAVNPLTFLHCSALCASRCAFKAPPFFYAVNPCLGDFFPPGTLLLQTNLA